VDIAKALNAETPNLKKMNLLAGYRIWLSGDKPSFASHVTSVVAESSFVSSFPGDE
jgi:hypothetical protein